MRRLTAVVVLLVLVPMGCGKKQTPESRAMDELEAYFARSGGPNDYDANGLTPLHKMADKGYKLAVELLIAHGARVDIPVRKPPMLGYTPLHFAAVGGHLEAAAFLIKCGAPLDAQAVGDADVGKSDAKTPLHLAAAGGRKALVALLLDSGARPSARDGEGKTPLDLAEAKGHTGTAELLRKAVAAGG